jgi:hypothetical protein
LERDVIERNEVHLIVKMIERQMELTKMLPRRFWWRNIFLSRRALVWGALSATAKKIREGDHLR